MPTASFESHVNEPALAMQTVLLDSLGWLPDSANLREGARRTVAEIQDRKSLYNIIHVQPGTLSKAIYILITLVVRLSRNRMVADNREHRTDRSKWLSPLSAVFAPKTLQIL